MKPHSLDLVSLVTGVVLLLVAVLFLLGAATDVSIDAEWVVPVTLIAVGAAGLAGALRGRAPDEQEDPA